MAIVKPTPKPSGEETTFEALFQQSGTSPAGEYVYWGTQRAKATASDERYGRAPRQVSKWLSEDDAMAEYYKLNEKQRGNLIGKFIVAGLLNYGAGALEGEKVWKDLVQASARYGQSGQKVGPMDLLAGYVKAAGGMAKNQWQQLGAFEVNVQTGEKRYAGPGTYLGGGRAQQVDTRTDLTDPDTARAIATKLFQDLMGRDPGAGELSAFASALHTAESNAPVVNRTVTQYDMETGQPVSSDTHTSGGMTAEGRALIGESQIKKSKEYGVTQAVTTYQGAFENLIYGAPE